MKKKSLRSKLILLTAILCMALSSVPAQAATAKWINGKTQYRKSNGKLAKSEIVKIGKGYYLFDQNAQLVKGKWFQLKNKQYCASSSGKL